MNLAPLYLTELLSFQNPSRTLRSCDQALLTVPRSRLKHRGDRAFTVSDPELWNSLPLHIRPAPTLIIFKFVI